MSLFSRSNPTKIQPTEETDDEENDDGNEVIPDAVQEASKRLAQDITYREAVAIEIASGLEANTDFSDESIHEYAVSEADKLISELYRTRN